MQNDPPSEILLRIRLEFPFKRAIVRELLMERPHAWARHINCGGKQSKFRQLLKSCSPDRESNVLSTLC